jgi:CelD/BcsL family acetyltransferase involved in cellulose biosynthesis
VLELIFLDEFGSLLESWSRLAEASGNIFSTWEWNLLWWQHFGRRRRLLLGVCRDAAGSIAAIVPLYVWRRRPLRVLRFVGHGHGDLLGPVCAHAEHKQAVEALRLALERVPHDVFVGDWLLGDEDWSAALGGRILREGGYPILHFDVSTWDEYLAARGRKFRKTIRSEKRRLEREHDARFRMTGDAGTLERDLDALFALHEARFGDHEGCYFCGSNEPFHRAFAKRALERGWLRLWLLDLDGKPVAAEYGFRFGDRYFAYQVGRDPAWDRASVGSVLEAYSIRAALDEGVREYRFLLGNEPYKYRFATEDPELETVGVPGSGVGRLAVNAVAASRHLRPLAALAKRVAS